MDCSVSTSASTIRSLHFSMPESSTHSSASVSLPSSPRSSALPSPPDSPSESVSSLPSVSSSFFFSSAAASPPHPPSHPDHAREQLIIPSLTLPSALRRPTPYGQSLGDVRILILGSKGAGKSFLSGVLVEDNEDLVDVGTWEEVEYGMVLRASTDWIEHKDAHGLERYEPSRNVEIVELPGYDQNDDAHDLTQTLSSLIQTPFYSVSELLDPNCQSCPVLANLISSPTTPLYTALIFLLPSTPSALEQLIIDNLGPQIPIIVLPRLSTHNSRQLSILKISSIRPSSAISLRTALFHSPETLATLRSEASDRFLRWREVEREVSDIHADRRAQKEKPSDWNKSTWEAQWELHLSHDVAKRLRERDGTITGRQVKSRQPAPCFGEAQFDPLHLPSLVVFSLSLLGPLRKRMGKSIMGFIDSLGDPNVKIALLGGFCVGISIGLLVR